MSAIPVILVSALQDLPAFVRSEFGDRTLARAGEAAGLDLEMIRNRECFIPQHAAVAFLEYCARAAGGADFVLACSPRLSLSNYGLWGAYVLGAGTLGAAIGRAMATLGYHSTGDTVTLTADGDAARLSYRFALAGTAGYRHAACVSACVLVNLCRHYAPGRRPLGIELDIPRPRGTSRFEQAFRCPVVWDAPAVAVVIGRDMLETPPPVRTGRPTVTLADLRRARIRRAPRDTPGIVAENVLAQILGGSVSVDNAARAMGVSVRGLQRDLGRDGTDFRTIVNRVRSRRAMELLRDCDASITSIALELGYSAPGHFARAFRRETGRTPSAFRAAAAGPRRSAPTVSTIATA